MEVVYGFEPAHPDDAGLVGGNGTNLENLSKGVTAHFLILEMVDW